jgi:PAS domain-containing protein
MPEVKNNGRPIPPALRAMLGASDGILDLLPIATFICDASGTILQYNRHAVKIWGRAPQYGQTHEQFTDTCKYFEVDGSPLARSMLAEVLANGEPLRDKELLVQRHDGSQVIVSLNIDPLRTA